MSTVQTVQKSLRIPRGTFDDIEKIASETGREFSSIAKDLLAEAVKIGVWGRPLHLHIYSFRLKDQ